MIQNRDIVVLSTQDFDDLWTRKQRWAVHLSARNRVLYVESQMHWITVLREWPKLRERLIRSRRAIREVRPNLWVWTPPVMLPGQQISRFVARWNNRRLARLLKQQLQRLGFDKIVLWSYTPYSSDLIGSLASRYTVYECVDDFAAARGLIRSSLIRRMEDDTFRRADLTVVTTPELGSHAETQSSHWRLSPNACDVDHFALAGDPETPIDGNVQRLKRPIFGFIGAVAYWVDLGWLAHLARARPEATILVVGPIRVNIRPYIHLPNLMFIGEQPYNSLPQILRGIDVCLNVYKRDGVTRGASPLKLYEYLASGKPIVSSPMPEAERYRSVVRIAADPNAFVQCCDDCLMESDQARIVREHKQRVLAADHTWDARFAEIERWVSPPQSNESDSQEHQRRAVRRWRAVRGPETSTEDRNRPRHVVVNALSLTGPSLGGGYTYLTQLLPLLFDKYPDTRFTVLTAANSCRQWGDTRPNVTVRIFANVMSWGPMRSLYERYVAGRVLRRLRPDIYFAPHGLLPRYRVCPTVWTFQNIYFLNASEYAQWTARHWWGRLYERLRVVVLKRRQEDTVQSADRIIAVSDVAADALQHTLHVPRRKIRVVRHGVGDPFRALDPGLDDSDLRQRLSLPSRYMVSVGAIAPNKNLPRLLSVCARLWQQQPDAPDLVLAGPDWRGFSSTIQRRAKHLGIDHRVHWIGFVDPVTLAALYRGATLVIQLSDCESFGLPALEAMACGIPLIVANRSGLSEVGGEAAVQVDPFKTRDVVDAIARLLIDSSVHAMHSELGVLRATQFTWDKAAAQTYDVLATAAGWTVSHQDYDSVVHRVRRHLVPSDTLTLGVQ